ncbi:hypothetical protein [Desulfofustis glycolicus]|uniref:Uncharacterized protein n=1 Tax=Desulfofustis glycolicus DSM 9705 TaxID=1121409 RepID=A0A1M5W7A6_9BACT|nr:hypothetical protein [Desulfofustis glycolicus]MCB2217306.1 hypothetical protein [Desulfobulbaceae bacterium]SHH83469.1 hypothetical protein SAMN02745124_02130 [Desulfofustis glycolicus DSM 9705]
MTAGNLEKLSFRPISSLRNQILSSEYQVYACGKMFLRASILNENPNFSSSPECITNRTMTGSDVTAGRNAAVSGWQQAGSGLMIG